MSEASVSEVREQHPTARLIVALVVVAALWGLAMLAVATALVSPMMAFDDGARRSESIMLSTLAAMAAALLYFGSGPVAHRIARRRWVLALPLIGLVVWGIGVAIANAT